MTTAELSHYKDAASGNWLSKIERSKTALVISKSALPFLMFPPRYLIGETIFILRAATHLTQGRRDSGEPHYKPDQQIEARH
jgi:hypothetical protein